MTKVKVAVLCSGGGTNLQAILDAERDGKIPHGSVELALSDNASAYALKRAEAAGVKACAFDRKQYTDRAERERLMLERLKADGIQLVVLAGFLSVLSENFVKEFAGRMINIHPSLIPSFCGVGMYGLHVHEAALARGVKVTGATVHYVNEICDGGQIICQRAVEVKDGDTPKTLQERVMKEAEWVILPMAVEQVCKKLSEE